MAELTGNPQLEDGHARIANELIDALRRTYLSPCESKVVWEVIRRTYGWQKKTDRISYGQIAKDCLMDRTTAVRTVSRLTDRRIILHNDGSLGINKHYELWKHANLVTKQPLPDVQAERGSPSDQTATTPHADLVTKQPLPDVQAERGSPSDQTATRQPASDHLATAPSDQTATTLVTKQPLPDEGGVVAKWSPTKDSNKEKDKEREKDRTNWDSLWKQLWQIYPKKYAENSARSQFYGLMNSGVLSDQVLEESVFPAITALKGSRRWTERAGAFVPKLSDFLIDQRWIEGLELLERKKRGGNGENSRYRPEVPGNRPGGAFSDVDLIQG